MAPSRSTHVRLIPTLLYGLLCFVIVMQMLGTPTSLWTLDFQADIIGASLLEGISLPPHHEIPSPAPTTHQHIESSIRVHSILLEETLFRPPYVP